MIHQLTILVACFLCKIKGRNVLHLCNYDSHNTGNCCLWRLFSQSLNFCSHVLILHKTVEVL